MGNNKNVSQDTITALIRNISGQANTLTIPRLYIDILNNDIKSALFLSQCVYWTDRTDRPNGWFYKSFEDWKSELALSRHEVERIRDRVLRFVSWEVHQDERGRPVCWYRVDMDALTNAIVHYVENRQNDMRETVKTICPKPAKRNAENRQNGMPETGKTICPKPASVKYELTEPTSEPTSKPTTEPTSTPAAVAACAELPEDLKTSLLDMGLFEDQLPKIQAALTAGWSTQAIKDLVDQVQADPRVNNKPGVLLYRLGKQKPKTNNNGLWLRAYEINDDPAPRIDPAAVAAFEDAIRRVRATVPPVEFETWCSGLELVAADGAGYVVAAPNSFAMDKARKLLGIPLSNALNADVAFTIG